MLGFTLANNYVTQSTIANHLEIHQPILKPTGYLPHNEQMDEHNKFFRRLRNSPKKAANLIEARFVEDNTAAR